MKRIVNPIAVLGAKQRLGEDDAKQFALIPLIFLDAAKRGKCPHAGYNTLATTILAAASIASQTRSKAFYDLANRAYGLLVKAGMRPTDSLDLTTTEYNAVRAVISWYVRALPTLEIGIFSRAYSLAKKTMEH